MKDHPKVNGGGGGTRGGQEIGNRTFAPIAP